MAVCYGYKFRARAADGSPLAFGLVYSYVAGAATTAKATYADRECTIPNTNPVELDAAGQADIHLDGATSLVVKTAAGSTVATNLSTGGETGSTDTPSFGALIVSGSGYIDGNVIVAGDADINGPVNAAGYLRVTGNVTFPTAVSTLFWTVTCAAAVNAPKLWIYDYIQFTARAATGVPNNSIFHDSADNKIKLRDNSGNLQLLY